MNKIRRYIKEHEDAVGFVALVVLCISIMVITVSVAGCQAVIGEDGETTYRLADGARKVVDGAAELAPVVKDALTGLSAVYPALGTAFGIAIGVIGALVKVKPKLTEEHKKAELYENITKAIVSAIEEFKGTNGTDWDSLKRKLKAEFEDKVGPEALAVIEVLVQAYRKNQLEK